MGSPRVDETGDSGEVEMKDWLKMDPEVAKNLAEWLEDECVGKHIHRGERRHDCWQCIEDLTDLLAEIGGLNG